ncbi:MAG: imidazole glycerol phosphate synthase subunit HisH [Alphaproteobacteria bacterium]
MIAILDYGIGNLASIANIIRHIGGTATVTRDAGMLRTAAGLILPGIGSFDACVLALRRSGLLPVLEQQVRVNHVPLLGICVGMQMLGHGSAEGREAGLGWIDATARKFDPAAGIRVPHMGWNYVAARPDSPLFVGMAARPRFYFAHSYYVTCADPTDAAATADYGGVFAAALTRGNIHAAQFHPEKSHSFGMALFRNFLTLTNGAAHAA